MMDGWMDGWMDCWYGTFRFLPGGDLDCTVGECGLWLRLTRGYTLVL